MLEDQVKYSDDCCLVIEMAPLKKRYFDSFTAFPSNCFKKLEDFKDSSCNLFVILPL